MTLIAVYNDSYSTHLVSDSLVTLTVKDDLSIPSDQWLSTGVYLDEKEQLRCRYTEGLLKIWEIQNNLSIGLAGEVSLAANLLELVVNQSRIEQFNSFDQLSKFFKSCAFPSISPFKGSCELCGFIGEGAITTKFIFSLSDKDGLKIRKTNDPHQFFVVGSGSSDFDKIINRISRKQMFACTDPTILFSIFAEHLYMNQFIGNQDMITKRYIGGAISGLYYSDNKTTWQPSRSVIIFVNVGGTGFDAKFEWLPIVYKTWYDRGNIFSLSMFEQIHHFYQRITQYSNPLSTIWTINENKLTQDMKTFNANQLNVILLPKGIKSEFPSVLRASGKFQAFDELTDNGRIVGLRLNHEFFTKFESRFFVANDYTVKMGEERFPHLIQASRERIDLLDKERNPTEYINKQSELAVHLTTYGGNTKNIELLSEALSRFLEAYETSKKYKQELVAGTLHNLKQYIQDINDNLKSDEVTTILERNKDAYKRYLKSMGYN